MKDSPLQPEDDGRVRCSAWLGISFPFRWLPKSNRNSGLLRGGLKILEHERAVFRWRKNQVAGRAPAERSDENKVRAVGGERTDAMLAERSGDQNEKLVARFFGRLNLVPQLLDSPDGVPGPSGLAVLPLLEIERLTHAV